MKEMSKLEKELGHYRASSVGLASCEGKCVLHISLFDEHGEMFADAPLNMAICRDLGKVLTAVGFGANAKTAVEDWYRKR